MSVDQTSWEAAVCHLYEDASPYDATGSRRHENWVLDVLALMARGPDPGGWAGLDDTARSPEREASPMYPFVADPPEYIARRLQDIDRGSAENLLLALTDDGCTLSNLSRFAESEEELRAMARTILACYRRRQFPHQHHQARSRERHARLHIVGLGVQPAERVLRGLRPDRGLGHRDGHVLELLRLLNRLPPVGALLLTR